MERYVRNTLLVLSLAVGINLVLYLAQHLLGWSIALRYGAGALLLLLGAISMQGGSSRDTLITRRYVQTTSSEDDLEEFQQARRQGMAAGWLLVLVGAATLGLTLLFA